MSALYDPKCRELAEHFLADAKGVTDDDRDEFAAALQEVADDFMRDLECCRGCGACPGFIGAECDGECDHAKAEA